MAADERRSLVRGNFSFNVKFTTLSKNEYENLKKFNEAIFPPFKQRPGVDVNNRAANNVNSEDASVINYLVQIDEKLDQILDMLTKDESTEGLFNQGVGLNISGSGMNIMVEKPVDSGQIIRSKFYLSKFPLIFMDIFGEVIHVEQMDEDDRTHYNLGIKFLDLSINDRERIISTVFQRQRGDIRKIKNEA